MAALEVVLARALVVDPISVAGICSPIANGVLATRISLGIGCIADNAALDIVRVVWTGAALVFPVVLVTGRGFDADSVVFPDTGGGGASAVPVESGQGGQWEQSGEVDELHGVLEIRLLTLKNRCELIFSNEEAGRRHSGNEGAPEFLSTFQHII